MASIARDKNGLKRIMFMGADGKRKTIRLGKMTIKQAATFKTNLERLLKADYTFADVDVDWIDSLHDDIHAKMSKFDLVSPREVDPEPERKRFAVKEWVQQYIDSRPDVKEGTKRKWRDVEDKLAAFFKNDYIDDVTVQQAKNFRIYLKSTVGLSENTIRRHIGITRQFFNSAIDAEIINKNPFRGQPVSVRANPERFFYVTQEMALKVLDACPDSQWRLIFALARWGGLRCPSEVLRLKWQDVDFERSRFLVHASKTEHHADGGNRIVPMFPELRPLFQDCFDQAPEGAVYCLDRYKGRWSNLGVHFARIVKMAGIEPWSKIFQNCRSTRETELFKKTNGNVKAVCSWIGNSPAVAMKHYAQVTEGDLKEAAKMSLLSEAAHPAEMPCKAQKTGDSDIEETVFLPGKTGIYSNLQENPLGGIGLEPTTSCVSSRRSSHLS